ncbi:unnamed protein product [Rhizopus stolonifer]
MSRRNILDDYYSDQDIYPTRHYPGKRRPHSSYYDTLDDELEDALYDLDLEDRHYNERRPEYSYNRRRRPDPRQQARRRSQQMEEEIPRRGSNTSLSDYRRAHSYSMPQPMPHYVDSPPLPPRMPSPRYRRRSVNSIPASPMMEEMRRPGFVRRGSEGQYLPMDHRQDYMSPPRMQFPMPHPIERPFHPYFDPQPEADLGIWPPLPNNYPPMPIMNPMINPMMPPLWVPPPQPWPGVPEALAVNEPQPVVESIENSQEVPPPPPPPTVNTSREIPSLQGEGGPSKARVILPRKTSFLAGIFGLNETKEMKTAKEYQKLGFFWCWRIIGPEQSMHFESFSITNQKYIKRKIEKGQGDAIFLSKEKKLPGIVLIDVNQCRGCCMVRKDYYIQLEIKREQYNGDSDQYIFQSSSGSSW